MNAKAVGNRGSLFTPVLIVGCIIVLVGFAIRASFGVFQIPIEEEFGWPRSEFSLAIAIQNLAWGFGAPIFGAFAEKIGVVEYPLSSRLRFVKYPAVMMNQTVMASEETTKKAEKRKQSLRHIFSLEKFLCE